MKLIFSTPRASGTPTLVTIITGPGAVRVHTKCQHPTRTNRVVTWGGGGRTVGWPLNAEDGTSHVIQSVHGNN